MKRSVALGLAVTVSGCAPVFSDLQSAKLVGKGRVEATPSFSSVSFSDDEDSGHVQNHAGLQVATGVHDRIDLRVRYERVMVEDGPGVNALGFGPKIQLVEDHVAAYVPVGFAFGGDREGRPVMTVKRCWTDVERCEMLPQSELEGTE